MGNQLWTRARRCPTAASPCAVVGDNLPRNWQIVGQTANATQIRPYLDASNMSVDDPAVVAERQATAAQPRINDRDLTDNPALTGDPQVENRLPWYSELDAQLGEGARSVIGDPTAYMAQTGQPIAVKPPTGRIDPDADVGAAPYEANYHVYSQKAS